MIIYEVFPFTGEQDEWIVPEGIIGGEATFECWGAAGGIPSNNARRGKERQTKGGSGPRNNDFHNHPNWAWALGKTYSNNAGYAAGVKPVSPGETYTVVVGGNGKPGFSAIRLKANGNLAVKTRGGAGGFNGGGDGGEGAHTDRNLYNRKSTKVQFTQTGVPSSANRGDLWLDTDVMLVKVARRNYTGGGSEADWRRRSKVHRDLVGRSGGGGGGATDIRLNGDDLSDRILVAAGSGGAGGRLNLTGIDRWVFRRIPAGPKPPFGSDTLATGPTGIAGLWATAVNYLVGGWGRGGIGGGPGPKVGIQTTRDGGSATVGGSGGPSSDRHRKGKAPGAKSNSEGKGGTGTFGGRAGKGGTGGGNGALGQGGAGADANPGPYQDDFCAGGGGGGGGYHGGGGGGHGFFVQGRSRRRSKRNTHGAGGGGGSNYAAPVFSRFFLTGAVRPPVSVRDSEGANGRGGLARITYRMPPVVYWVSVPTVADAGSTFEVAFNYEPAEDGGAEADYLVVGSAADPTATFPTSQTVLTVTDKSQTSFTHEFNSPADGDEDAFFVKAVDTDGDSSAWVKHVVRGRTAPTPATIDSPTAGSQFVDSETVEWTLGSETPLVAYQLGLEGDDMISGEHLDFPSGLRPGGSRVNLATDPGFVSGGVWSSDNNTDLVAGDSTFPGISGTNGKIEWTLTEAEDAENHTTAWGNLLPEVGYRFEVGVASGTATDTRILTLEVADENGLLASKEIDLSTFGAGSYQEVEISFVPTGQEVVFRLTPSDTAGIVGNAETGQTTYLKDMLVELDYDAELVIHESFDDDEAGWTAAGADETVGHNDQGRTDYDTGALSITANTAGIGPEVRSPRIPVLPAQTHRATLYAFTEDGTATGFQATLTIHWFDDLGAPISTDSVVGDTALDTWTEFSLESAAPTNAVEMELEFHVNDDASVEVGDVVLLDDVSVQFEPWGSYFDGTNIGANEGSVAWRGTANASESVLTGVDVTEGVLVQEDTRLLDGSLYLDTFTDDAIVFGSEGARASVSVNVNPSIPATPTVDLTVDHGQGVMVLDLDAADGAVSNKTVSFDIFRNDVRIATGLTPDPDTRLVTYRDVPAHGEQATYLVRALDDAGGYADQTDGTVTEQN